MNSTAYKSTQLVTMQLEKAYGTQFEGRVGTEKKARPVAVLLYRLCVGVFAYGAFVAIAFK